MSERKINGDLINNFVTNKFKWNNVKTNYFLERNQINSVSKMLNYDKYPQM